MLPYKIIPMFKIGPLHVNMYGIMFAAGYLTAIMIAARAAKKRGIESDIIFDIAFYALLGGIIGARIFYVLFYWPTGVPLEFFDIFKIWNGGMAFYGGFLGALAAGYAYVKIKKKDFWEYADIFTLPLIAGHIIGRFGDYLTGAHPGKITQLPWGIFLENAVRHPVPLYEIIGLTAIAIIIFNFGKKLKHSNGMLFLAYVGMYAGLRIFLDFFRIESTDPRLLGLTPTQYLAIGLLFAVALLARHLHNKKQQK